MLNIIFDEKMQTKNIKSYVIKIHKIHETLKDGWQEYNLYFYISGISVIIGGFFNIAGFLAFVVSMLFFYILGKFHMKIKKHTSQGK